MNKIANTYVKRYLVLFILFNFSCCTNKEKVSSMNQATKTCSFVKDSVDFGTGISPYDQDKLCLDTIFTFDYFRTSNVSFNQVSINKSAKTLKWNDYTINLSLRDSVVLQIKEKSDISLASDRFTFESAFEISIGKKQYLAVFLFPNGIMSHLIPHPLILINSENDLVKFINDESIFSPNPACFCDIDSDNQLDYISIDYYKEKVRFYGVDKWNLKPKHDRKLKQLIDMIYIMH